MSDTPKYETREQWLLAAVLGPVRKHFGAAGYIIPPLRVACGWPHKGGTCRKKRVLGQAWTAEAASDGIIQIFISPYLANLFDPFGVLAVLVHEVCHASVGNAEGHNKVFGKCARAVWLDGKLTSTFASEKLIEEFKSWAKELGTYPHGQLDLLKAPVKKQTTRMIKMECAECGYVARTSKKWLDELGAAWCPKHGEMKFELPEGDENED